MANNIANKLLIDKLLTLGRFNLENLGGRVDANSVAGADLDASSAPQWSQRPGWLVVGIWSGAPHLGHKVTG